MKVAKEAVVHATDQLPVLYLILRYGAGVDAGVGRAYRVRDFWFLQGVFKDFWRGGEWGSGEQAMQYLNQSRCWMLKNSAG